MATDIIARGMITEYIAGTNINFTENRDGTVEISASGSISSEDSVARDAIGNHKSDTSNPHNVTPAQIGLGNVDNTSDLDKPISTAVQKAIDSKADKTVATTSADGLMSAEDKSKLDAFEITKTGGKLHDKDIATTDLIPTSLPANGGSADYATNAGNAEKLGGKDASAYSTSIIKSVTFSAATTNGYIWTGIAFPKYVIGVDLGHFDVIAQFYKGNNIDAARAEWAMIFLNRDDVTTPLNGSFNGVIYYID